VPEPLEPSDDFADLVERLRRPTGPSRGSEWQGTESVTIPAALDEALAAFVETHRRRGIRPSRWPLAGKPPALLVDQCTRAQEAFLVDAVARRLVRRLYSFDMRDPDATASLVPLGNESPCVVHLHSLEAAADLAGITAAIRSAPTTVAIVATVTDRALLAPQLARCFALRLSWETGPRVPAPGRTSRDLPQPS
jgi:hypothetical protein